MVTQHAQHDTFDFHVWVADPGQHTQGHQRQNPNVYIHQQGCWDHQWQAGTSSLLVESLSVDRMILSVSPTPHLILPYAEVGGSSHTDISKCRAELASCPGLR